MNRTVVWAYFCPVFLFILSLQAVSVRAASSPQDRQARIQKLTWSLPASSTWPLSTPMNLELVYRYTHPDGSLEIVNAYPVGEKRQVIQRNADFSVHALPDYFLLGDGALSGRVILVDKRPGSRLAQVLDELVHQILDLYGLTSPSQLWDSTLTSFLANQVQDYLSYPPIGAIYDPAPGLTPGVKANADQLTKSLQGEDMGHFTAAISKYLHPVRAFEIALRTGDGVCIDMALLTSFLLERFGRQHRVVFGANVSKNDDSGSGGHTWVELPTGEVLDPAWKFRSRPDPQHSHPDHPDWFYVNQQFRFGYPSVPIVLLGP